ncbi:MAG TPA: hypothetical protein VET26_11890 [Candidatus Sulfotelmatobacter sp.]|nr:hypothetical protein [Candidatus Sulfotelmatobacter sp.]
MAQLGYVPAALTQREYTYVPPVTPSSTALGIRTVTAGTATNGSPLSDQTMREIRQLLADGRGGTLFRYSSPSSAGYLQATEQPAGHGQSLPVGDSIVVGGVQATVRQEGDTTTLFLIRYGTFVTIQTNLGKQEASKVAEGLAWN